MPANPIGVFDSGIGGLTTLSTLLSACPHEDFVYKADFGFAPYGDKSTDFILKRAQTITQTLLDEGAKAIVVACNTATAVAVETLRERFDVPVIGAEPALRPACTKAGVRSVLVLLTPAAARQPRFQALCAQFPDVEIKLVTVPTLATQIEERLFDGEALRQLTERTLHNVPRCDAVVLGCTHYVYLRKYVEAFFGSSIPVYDGNAGIAARVQTILDRYGLRNPSPYNGQVKFLY